MNSPETVKCLLVMNDVFFGRLALTLDWGLDVGKLNPHQTAYTDGRVVHFSEKILREFTNEELRFVAAHEVLHVAYLHLFRMGNRIPQLWNVACDYVINAELLKCGIGKMPAMCLYDKKYEGMSEEAVYDDLFKNAIKIESPDVFENCDDGNGVNSDQAIQISSKVHAAVEAAKAAGKMPGGLRDFVQMHKPQIDWKSELRRFSYPCFPDGRTWSRPHKRTIASGLYLPGKKMDGTSPLVCGIDTSGSISNQMINSVCSEVDCICREVKPSELHVLWFHSNVWRIDTYEKGEEIKIPDDIETGGTSFHEVFDYFNELKSSPCLIMLTDGYAAFPGNPGRQVIWCLNTDVTPEYGHIVRIKEESL